MERTVLTFGLILGTMLAGQMVYFVNLLYNNPGLQTNDIMGYAAMIIVFSLTFFAIRNYRDKQLNGVISMGTAFKTGALIAVLGATMYVVTWLFYYYLVVPDFMDKYAEHCMIDIRREGATAAEISAKQQEVDQIKELYESPVFVVVMTYMEVLPIGLIVAFISALILKRKPATVSTP